MSFCTSCGASLDANEIFCYRCGIQQQAAADRLNSAIQSLGTVRDEYHEEIASLQDDVEAIKASVENLQRENTALLDRHSTLQSDVEKLEDQKRKIEGEIAKMGSTRDAVLDEVDRLQKVASEIRASENRKSNLETELAQLQRTIRALQEEQATLSSQVETKKNSLLSITRGLESATASKADKEGELASITTNLEQRSGEFRELEARQKTVTSTVAQLQLDISQLEQRKATLEAAVNVISKSLDEHMAKRDQTKHEVDDLEKRKEALNHEVQAQREAITHLVGELTTLEEMASKNIQTLHRERGEKTKEKPQRKAEKPRPSVSEPVAVPAVAVPPPSYAPPPPSSPAPKTVPLVTHELILQYTGTGDWVSALPQLANAGDLVLSPVLEELRGMSRDNITLVVKGTRSNIEAFMVHLSALGFRNLRTVLADNEDRLRRLGNALEDRQKRLDQLKKVKLRDRMRHRTEIGAERKKLKQQITNIRAEMANLLAETARIRTLLASHTSPPQPSALPQQTDILVQGGIQA